MKMELRTTDLTLSKSDGDLVVSGYVNRPGTLSEILGTTKKFREKIEVGAFRNALANASNGVDFLAEHDSTKVLSSTRNSSLELREDAQGLFMSAKISPTSYGRDYFQLITDGLISAMSFGFSALKDSWSRDETGMAIRTVHELSLYEISAVKNPAYDSSILSARSIDIEETIVPENILETTKTENERGHLDMKTEMKMEKRTNTNKEFEQALRTRETRNLQTTENGGALIPENVTGEIIKKMEEVSPAFANARKFPSVYGTLKVAKENDSVTGGFFGEGTPILEQELGFDDVKLSSKRLGAAVSLSNQFVNEPAVDLVRYVSDLLGRRIVKTAEQAIFNGDGITEFTGILGDESVRAIEASFVTPDTLMEMYTSLHPAFLEEAAFYVNRKFFNQIVKLKDTNGQYFLQNGVVNGKPTYTMFGMPIYVTEALADSVPAVFANMNKAYAILIKQEMSIKHIVADSTQALRGSQLIVMDAAMDGAVIDSEAIVKLKIIQ